MGTFYIGCRVENHVDRNKAVRIPNEINNHYLVKLLVDTGSEYTWIPRPKLAGIGVAREKKDVRFVMANTAAARRKPPGEVVTRNIGFAIVRVGKRFTIDEVVFAESGDLALLGARTLEGLSLCVDAARKKLVASGPLPAA